jgi:tetratricopeptide (TPR) repeat protein
MPTTYNGIGTHYYGKKNLTLRRAVCPHCNREVDLKSYDTRLWFVILFVPVIPLGRKRIIDYCPACTRHHIVELQKWETAKQLEISGAQEEYRKNPTPEGAIALHQHLYRFHQHAEAEEFQKEMAEKYADNAKVQAYLGAALEHVGKPTAAAEYYARALKLRPDLPEARIGVALGEIREGRLDEARKLLDFLEKPGASHLYSLEPLERLAVAYQNVNRHDEALELFVRLQAELPKLGEVKAFRDMVKRSEKGRGSADSILPKQKFSWRGLFTGNRSAGGQPAWRALALVGILVGLIALGFVIANEYIRRHRTLYLVNTFTQPVNIEIPGVGTTPRLRKVGQLSLAEGRYHAKITGAVTQELDFEIRSGYFSRWFGDPVWVINAGGAAPLIYQRVTYSKNPPPASYSFRVGETFQYFPDVTHPFKELPDSLQMKEHESRVLTHLEVYQGKPEAVFVHLDHEGNKAQALTFAEAYLRAHPTERVLLENYVAGATRASQGDRLERYLRAGLTNRPVSIEWHRAYQGLHRNHREQAQLIAAYDALLRAEPTNSALLFLRGRIEPDHARGRQLLQQAAAADPKNAYASFALGYDQMAAGNWQAARPLVSHAVELAPDNPAFLNWLFITRLAAGEAAALQTETREHLRADPLDFLNQMHLVCLLAFQGEREQALRETDAFETRWLRQYGTRSRSATDLLRRLVLYGVGDFAELEKRSASDQSPEGRFALAQALIEQGRVADALKLDLKNASADEQPFWLLSVSVALSQAGDHAAAAEWRQKAITALEAGSEDWVHAASVLAQTARPSAADLDGIILPPGGKAVFLAALAQRHPDAAGELNAAARRFNVEPRFPYHLVKRVTAGTQASAERR